MSFEDIKDPATKAIVKVLAYEMYNSYGDAWPVFWSTLDDSQKAKLFRVAHEVKKASVAHLTFPNYAIYPTKELKFCKCS